MKVLPLSFAELLSRLEAKWESMNDLQRQKDNNTGDELGEYWKIINRLRRIEFKEDR